MESSPIGRAVEAFLLESRNGAKIKLEFIPIENVD